MEYSKLETVDTFNLFEVGPMIAPAINKPRQASEQECKVYAQWLALKSGLLVASDYFPKLKWKETGRTRNDRVCVGAYFDDQFIAFPGADQNGAVEFEILGDDGEPVSSTKLYQKTKGAGAGGLNLLKADIAAIKKAAKEPAPVAAEIESEPAPIVDTVPAAPALVAEYDAPATPSEGIKEASQPVDESPMFSSVADFKRAATVGTVWARSNYENGQWQDRSPMLRTIAKVQSEDLVCGIAENAKGGDEYLAQIASREKSGQWLGFPKKGRWESDSKGMIWLDLSGRKMFRFEPVDINSLSQPESETEISPAESESDAPAMVDAAPVEINTPSEPEQEIEAIEPAAFTLSGTIRATMPRGGAWDWSRGYQGNEHTPSEVIAPAARDDRPRRLRIVMAYIRMRKERAALRSQIELGMSQLENANAARKGAMRQSGYNERIAHANLQKRRRAVERAIVLRKQSNNWRKMCFRADESSKMFHEKYANAESRAQTFGRTAKHAKDELDQLKAMRADPSNPERASDLIKLRDERDQARGKLETVTSERDRLKASIEASAGTLDEMIDRAFRAEAELRDMKAPRGYQVSAPVIAYQQAA